MPHSTPPLDGTPSESDVQLKREYRTPKLQDLGSVSEMTTTGAGAGSYDGSGYTS